MILLSLIIPVYNVEPYIGQCLQSIADNSADMSPIEIIIVNDGTRDSSMDIVYRYSDTFPNIHIVEQDNLGLSSARTAGIALAHGEWIWFIDSDDFLLPEALGSVIAKIDTEKNVDLLIYPLLWVYQDESKNHIDYQYSCADITSGASLLKNQQLPFWGIPRYIINRRLFLSQDLFFPQGLIHEDEYFGRVLLYKANSVIISKEPVYCYRQREKSITKNRDVRTSYDLVGIYKYLSSFCNSSVKELDKPWFRSNIIGLLLESYTKNKELYRTPDFHRFRQDNQSFILQEYKKYSKEFNKKRKLADMLLIHTPTLHSLLVNVYYGKK